MNIEKLKYTLVFFLISFSICAQTNVTKSVNELVWETDMVKANEISQSSKKPIFAFFTGSDWCGWCKKLQKDVFAKTEFVQWANKNVVLLELDFPRTKQLSAELTKQNQGLQQTFQVQGFPTIWMFYMSKDEKGQTYNISALGSLGYPRGAEVGKEQVKFLEEANSILEKGKAK